MCNLCALMWNLGLKPLCGIFMHNLYVELWSGTFIWRQGPKFPKKNETYRRWPCNTRLNFFFITFLLKPLLSFYFPIEISTVSLHWNPNFLFTFLLKSRHSLYFSIEASTFSLLFSLNLYSSRLKSLLFFFPLNSQLKSLLSLFFSIEISTLFIVLCFSIVSFLFLAPQPRATESFQSASKMVKRMWMNLGSTEHEANNKPTQPVFTFSQSIVLSPHISF